MKGKHRSPARTTLVALALATGASAQAQQQTVKPPIAQYWMDVATHTFAGMPEMPGMSSIPFLGGSAYGNARGMAPGRWLDLALHTRARPGGTEGSHAIPSGMQMGSALPLLPVRPETPPPREPGEPDEGMPERPTGRILLYWGCSETVRQGQPRVVDLATAGPREFARVFAGRFAPDRGARIGPGYSIWPNEKNRASIPREASLIGDHAVSGDGVPPSLRFAIGQAQDFMPAIQLASSGQPADSIALQWQPIPTARAYFLHAMGKSGKDMVLWSSSETPDSGMGLFDYLSNPTIDRWVRERVLLPASETRCAVPKGIFASSATGEDHEGGGMLRMIAYGGELNLAHPPRPADPRKPWEPEWSARVRVKATTMSMLGMDSEAGDQPGAGRRSAPQESSQGEQQEGQSLPGIPAIPGAGKAIDAIRGIFGR